jgi:carboxypeptidase C (cathepsin A)
VLNWLSAFPEYAQLPMFLVGESYAGVYMPMLFEGLLDSPTPPNLVGLGLGGTLSISSSLDHSPTNVQIR